MPRYQGDQVPDDRPKSGATRTTTWVTAPGSMSRLADRRGDGRSGQTPDEVQ